METKTGYDQKERAEIKKILDKRKIDTLIHFTRIENLPGILENGIRPRAVLDGEKAVFNDEYRFDNCENAVCTTIEFPNYRMFYGLRNRAPGSQWVVFEINAEVLLDFRCAFCETNAGSRPMFSMPLEERMGAGALENLFKDESEGRKRAELNIPDRFPTNPQAEVLVFGAIPVRYIKSIMFYDAGSMGKYKNSIPSGIKTTVQRFGDYFSARCDYAKWK